MNKFLLTPIVLVFYSFPAFAQQVDSIYFHLYTDSLKKGVHNYINVDGKLSNGTWFPLTSREIQFSSSAGRFEGNDLIIEPGFTGEYVMVKAVLRANPRISKETRIYIKKSVSEEKLKTLDEILRESPRRKRQAGRNSS